jgi:hypothetical protein
MGAQPMTLKLVAAQELENTMSESTTTTSIIFIKTGGDISETICDSGHTVLSHAMKCVSPAQHAI